MIIIIMNRFCEIVDWRQCLKLCFLLAQLLEAFTITNFQYTVSSISTCTESKRVLERECVKMTVVTKHPVIITTF